MVIGETNLESFDVIAIARELSLTKFGVYEGSTR